MSLYPACFLAYVLLPALLLTGVRPNKKRTIMDRDFTDAAKGFLVVYVAIHHFTQLMQNQGYMRPFAFVGFVCVSFFFFSSGYGLTAGYLKRGNLDHFFRKRFLRLYFPFVIANIITALLYLVFSASKPSLSETLLTSFTMRTVYHHKVLWYIAVQAVMYLLFYLAFLIKGKQICRLLALLGLTIGYIAVCMILKVDFWRYNTVLCFPLGAAAASYKTQIEAFLKRCFGPVVCALTVLTVLAWLMVYRNTHPNAGTYAAALLFSALLCVISIRITFSKKGVFHFVGGISYEYYIMQLPCIYVLNEQGLPVSMTLAAVLLLAAACAFITHSVFKAGNDQITKQFLRKQ